MKVLRIFLLTAVTGMLLSAGCAGIKPAVQPPPPPMAEEVDAAIPAEGETESEETVQSEPPASAAAEETATVEQKKPKAPGSKKTLAAPIDTLDFPETALPPSPASLSPVAFLPSAGPAERGAEPVELGDGWRVQVASVNNQAEAREIERDVASKSGTKVHTRYHGDRYTLLVGQFDSEEAANVLRDKLRVNGYEGAFVVRAPVASPAAPEMPKETVAPSAPVEPAAGVERVDGWSIQVMSLGSKSDAERAAVQASAKTGLTGYVEEVDGAWKVRVGGFLTREEAQKAREQVIAAGYEGAFPVAAKINPTGSASKGDSGR